MMYYIECRKVDGKTCDVYGCPCGHQIAAPVMELAVDDVVRQCPSCKRVWNIPGVGSSFDAPVELSASAGAEFVHKDAAPSNNP